MAAAYWLFKSEPDAFSWEMLKARGKSGEPWDGVRNYQARNNMRAMQVGDLGFFYHSNEGKEIVGILEVIALAHPDPKDDTGKWECVDVSAVARVPRPVTLVGGQSQSRSSPSMVLVSEFAALRAAGIARRVGARCCRMGGLDAEEDSSG